MNSNADNEKHDKHDLTGKRAVVTGGTRGIGEAVVRRLLEAGADVLATARTEPTAVPDGAAFVAADVTTQQGAEAIAAAAQERFGGADIVVHNAGGGSPFASAAAIPATEWQSALDLNFLSAVRLDALLAPAMREAGSGAIVHVSSAAVLTPVGMFLPYTTAKAALENYSRGLAIDMAPSGVRVNVVSPGRTETPGGVATRQQWAAIAAGSDAPPAETNADDVPPLGREGRPDDIADAVHFLVSGRATWLTGRNLIVDGGEFPMG